MPKAAATILSVLFFFGVLPGRSFAELNPLLESASRYDDIKVERVVSVDRFILENAEKLALIGVEGLRRPKVEDAERDDYGRSVKNDDPTTSLEQEAFQFVRDLVEGKPVSLEFDLERRDRGSNLAVYLFLPDGRMLNEELLRLGYADLSLRMPNMKYAERLRKAYQEARREMRGVQGNW